MTERVELELKLLDKVSPAARKSIDSILKIAKTTDKVKRREMKLQGRLQGMIDRDLSSQVRMRKRLASNSARASQRASAAFFKEQKAAQMAGAAKAQRALGAATRVVAGAALAAGAGVVAFTGKVFQAASSAQTSRKAFELLTGSTEDGNRAFELATATSKELGTSLSGTRDSFRKLLAAQFSIEQAETFVRLSGDLRAIGIGADEAKRALTAISQIKAKGRLQAEELLQLAEAGISQELVFQALEKRLGKTREEIRKLQEQGEISSDIALEAIQGAILKKTGGKSAGDAALEFSKTLPGQIQRAQSAIDRFFDRVATGAGPVFDRLTAKLAGFAERLETVDPAPFAALASSAVDLALALFDIGVTVVEFVNTPLGKFTVLALGAVGGLVLIAAVIAKVTAALAIIGGAWAFVSGAIATFTGAGLFGASVFGLIKAAILVFVGAIGIVPLAIAAAVAAAIALFVVFFDDIDAFFGGAISRFFEWGGNMMSGLWEGIKSWFAPILTSVGGFASSIAGKFKSFFGIASPSKLMAGFGMNIGEGLAVGMQDSAPRVRSSASQMSSEATGGALAGLASASVTVAPSISVSGAQNPAETAAVVKDVLVTELGDALNRVALQMGA